MPPPAFLVSELQKDKIRCTDIGARFGIIPHYRHFKEIIEIDAFEPEEDVCKSEQARSPANVQWFPVGLAKTTGVRDFYITEDKRGCSLYIPNEENIRRFSYMDTRMPIRKISLDFLSYEDFRMKYKRPRPNCIKIDTEGSEHEIISSFSDDDLAEAACILTRVCFKKVHDGQSMFNELDNHIQSRGYTLFDIKLGKTNIFKEGTPYFYLQKHLNLRAHKNISQQVISGLALYFKTYPDHVPPTRREALKLYILYLLYKFYDSALELAEKSKEKGLITAQEASELATYASKLAPRTAFQNRSNILSRGLNFLLRKFDLVNDEPTAPWAF